ncbi:MAG: PCRF domain-containing protein, partial [Stellaceae bacterium]
MSLGALEAKLDKVTRRHAELAATLAEPARSGSAFAKLAKEYSDLTPLVEAIAALKETEAQRTELAALAGESDPELRILAADELAALEKRLPEMEHRVKLMLLPKDEADERNAILELRAGTGGEE